MTRFAVDGNWYMHRLYHTKPEVSRDIEAWFCRSFIGSVCKDALLVKATEIAVAFDGDSVFRYKLDGEYKANRSESASSEVYAWLPALKSALQKAGIHFIHSSLHEADDVLASLSAQGPITISTGDKDAYQYLRPGVVLVNPTFKVNGKPKPLFTTHKDVVKRIGLTAEQALDYQTLVGDKIDNVPQLVSPAKAKKGLAAHGSIVKWAKADSAFRLAMQEVKPRLELNRKLVRLLQDLKVSTKSIAWDTDLERWPRSYADLHALSNRKTKSLF